MENRKDFDRDLEQLTTRQTPMTQEERDRILALAWSKAGLEPAAPQPKAPPARRAAKPLRTVAIAAAAVCAMGVCGEIAHGRLSPMDGNASYRNYIIDAIYHLDGETLEHRARYKIL